MTSKQWLHVVVIVLALGLPDFVGAQGATRKVTDMEKREVALPAQISKVATMQSPT